MKRNQIRRISDDETTHKNRRLSAKVSIGYEPKITEAQRNRLETLMRKRDQINNILTNIAETKYSVDPGLYGVNWSIRGESEDHLVYEFDNKFIFSDKGPEKRERKYRSYKDLNDPGRQILVKTRITKEHYGEIPRDTTRERFETALRDTIERDREFAEESRQELEDYLRKIYVRKKEVIEGSNGNNGEKKFLGIFGRRNMENEIISKDTTTKKEDVLDVSKLAQETIDSFRDKDGERFKKYYSTLGKDYGGKYRILSSEEVGELREQDLAMYSGRVIESEKEIQLLSEALKESLATPYIDREPILK